MTDDEKSCKLCDGRLTCISTSTMTQKLVDYHGPKVEGRKYPVLSSPENGIATEVVDQSVFIFGGLNTVDQFADDKGYHMYHIRENTMELLPITSRGKRDLLMRS